MILESDGKGNIVEDQTDSDLQNDPLAAADEILVRAPNPQTPYNVEGIVCLHVDDSISGGTAVFKERWDRVCKDFIMGDSEFVGSTGVPFCGNIIRAENLPTGLNFTVGQEHYATKLEEIKASNSKLDQLLDENLQKSFRQAIGRLNWIGFRTRPDIAFQVNALSSKNGRATFEDLDQLNKLIRKTIYNKSVRLLIQPLKGDLQVCGHTDASFNRLVEGPARIGGIFWLVQIPDRCRTREKCDNLHFISNGDAHVICPANPLFWRATSVQRAIDSVLDAELIVAQWGYNLGTYLKYMAVEMLSLIHI